MCVDDQSRLLAAIYAMGHREVAGGWISVEALEAEVQWEPGDVRTGPAIHALGKAGFILLHADVREVAMTEKGRSIVRASMHTDS